MRKIWLILVLLTLLTKVWGQSYIVEYVFQNFGYTDYVDGQTSETAYAAANVRLSSGTYLPFYGGTYTEGNFIVSSKPTELRLWSYYVFIELGYIINECTENAQVINLNFSGDCATFHFEWGACSYGILDFTIRPVLSISGTSSGDYCENETITLDNTSGFNAVQWQYSVSSGIWQDFSPGGNSVTFGIQDIFGGSYSSYLNQPIYFRYSYSGGSCDPNANTSNALGPYNFGPIRPEVLASQVVSPSCKDGTNAVIKINSVSRSVLSGETLTYTVYTPGNSFVAQTSSAQQPSAGNPIEIRGDNTTVAPFGIAPGNYKILVQSNLSLCGAVTYYTVPPIPNPTLVTFSNNTPVQPSCYGGSNGSIAINASGGSGSGYTFSKNNGSTFQTSNVLSGLTTGGYPIKVKDGNGCASASSTVTVNQPTDITVSSVSVTSAYNGRDISCVGSANGQITATASGGTGTLNYSKDGSTFQPSNIFNSLGVGTYTITVRDGNNCTKSSSPIAIVSPPSITATTTPTAASCNGLANGSIQVVNPQGGTGALAYSINGTTFQPGTTFTNLVANNYTVTIRDANSCTTTVNTTVNQPAAITVTPTPTLVTCSGGNDGSISITAANGTGTYTYSKDGTNFQASNLFTGLSANAYTLTVKDQNNCTGTNSVTINSNPIITSSIAISTPISCNGGSNGALNLTPAGGVGPYTFTWSNSATTEDISGLATGTYSVIIKDTKNCQQTFNRTLTQPLPVTVSGVTSNFNGSGVSCFGGSNGSVNITPSGGNGGYTFSWSNGAATEDISGLIAGSYSVMVTDSKSCTGNQTIQVTQPLSLVTTSTSQNISCFGGNTGSIALNTAGGATNYEYSINNGSSWQSTPAFNNLTATSYTVLTRDANGCGDSDNILLTSPADLVLTIDGTTNTTCNQSNGSATASASGGVSSYAFTWFNGSNAQIGNSNSITNLSAGAYHVVVMDQNSCSKQQNFTISSSGGPAIAIASITPASCSNTTDGSATITISQGQTPYTILWPNGQTSTTATNLGGGDYIVEVRDNTNCLSLQTVSVPSPSLLTIQTITQQNPNCFGTSDGTIEVAAQGGNGTYTYSWNTGPTNNILTNLNAGTYTLTVKDIKNCQATQQFTLVDPPQFKIDLGVDQKICEGQTVIKRSDIDNATYEWAGPNNFVSTLQQIALTQPGVYTLTVTNQNGCKATDSFELSFDTNLLKADFLMVSEAYVGDTIIVIDISWPLPSSISWQFDPATVVLDESQDFSLIRFDDPGQYNVSILAQLAQCASSHSQFITIIENPNGKVGGRTGSEDIIRLVHVFPNPTTDRLTVEIELNEESQATVEIYNVQSNRRELSQTFKDDSFYRQDFRIGHFQSGLYVVVVKVGNEMKSVKVIKL